MIFRVHFDDIEKIKINKKSLSEISRRVIEKEGFRPGNISVIITSDRILENINKRFLGKENLTDIVAFKDTAKETVNGEIYISYDRVKFNSIRYCKRNFKQELYRVIIHGILHLIGYNDSTVQERKQMIQMENSYLNELNLLIGGTA